MPSVNDINAIRAEKQMARVDELIAGGELTADAVLHQLKVRRKAGAYVVELVHKTLQNYENFGNTAPLFIIS